MRYPTTSTRQASSYFRILDEPNANSTLFGSLYVFILLYIIFKRKSYLRYGIASISAAKDLLSLICSALIASNNSGNV